MKENKTVFNDKQTIWLLYFHILRYCKMHNSSYKVSIWTIEYPFN